MSLNTYFDLRKSNLRWNLIESLVPVYKKHSVLVHGVLMMSAVGQLFGWPFCLWGALLLDYAFLFFVLWHRTCPGIVCFRLSNVAVCRTSGFFSCGFLATGFLSSFSSSIISNVPVKSNITWHIDDSHRNHYLNDKVVGGFDKVGFCV